MTHLRFSWYAAKVFRKSSRSWVDSPDDSSGLFGAMLRLSHSLGTTGARIAMHTWFERCVRRNGECACECAARVGRDDE